MASPAYKIITERCVIRCFDPKDAHLLKAAIDESLEHLSPWLAWTKGEPEDIEKKVGRIRQNRANFDMDINYVYGIFAPDNSKLIGCTALMKRVGDDALEIGYWLHKDYTGRGYALEAASALTRVAFEVNGVERVEIHCDKRNAKSAAIPEKLGFTMEAIVRVNEKDNDGNRLQNMNWVLFREEYEKSGLTSFPIKAFGVTDEQII